MKKWWGKYYIHFILVGLVIAVGAVATGFYISEFGANGLSKETEDWANFATYISGTVGVSAVLATLVAFVITLRQQQALIDSQDKMLDEQEVQLEIAREQLAATERRSSVERAYLNVKDVLPKLLNAFSKYLDMHFAPEDGSDLEEFLLTFYAGERVFTAKEFYESSHRILHYIDNFDIDANDVSDYVEMSLGHSNQLCIFLVNQLGIESDLFTFVDVQMSEAINASHRTYWFYIQCLLAYRFGCGQSGFYEDARILIGERKNYEKHPDEKIRNFYLLGRALKNREEDQG